MIVLLIAHRNFDDFPALNLDQFGDVANQGWLRHGIAYSHLTPGEEFNLVFGKYEINYY